MKKRLVKLLTGILMCSLCVGLFSPATGAQAASKKTKARARAAYKKVVKSCIEESYNGTVKAVFVDIDRDGIKDLIIQNEQLSLDCYSYKKGSLKHSSFNTCMRTRVFYNKKRKSIATVTKYDQSSSGSYNYYLYYRLKRGTLSDAKQDDDFMTLRKGYKKIKLKTVKKANIKKFIKKM